MHHDLAEKKHILIHMALIVCYIASITMKPASVVSLMLRVIGGLLISFYITGQSLSFIMKKYLVPHQNTFVGDFAFNFLLSFSCFTFISIILSFLYSLSAINLILIMAATVVISDITALKLDIPKKSSRMRKIQGDSQNLWLIMLVLFFGFLIALLFRNGFSWPSMPGWDVYCYLAGSNWVLAHNGTRNIMFIPPGSFLPSSYLFQILVASLAIVLGIDPYLIFWYGPFFTIPLYGLLVCGVSYNLKKDSWQALVAALIAVTICGGEHFLAPHYFLPSTIFIILFLFILITILNFPSNGYLPKILTCGFLLLCYAIYYYPFIITFPIFLFLLIRKSSKNSWLYRNSINIFAISLIIMALLSWIGASMFSERSYSLSEKVTMIRNAYPDLLWFLSLLGGLIVIARCAASSEEGKNLIPILAYTFSLIVIYFMPSLELDRTEIILRVFLAFFASFTFVWLKNSLLPLNHVVLSFHKFKISLKKMRWGFICILLCFSMSILTKPYLYYASNVPKWSNISKDEYLAAEWIKQNSHLSSYILTDPSTGYILRGLTLRNASTSFIIHGHTPSPHAERWTNLSNLIYNFFIEPDPLRALNYLNELPISPTFIVVTTRTSNWVRSGANSTFCAPTEEIRPFRGMEKFSSPLVTLVKSWETVRIYKLNKIKMVPIWIDEDFLEGWSWYLDGAYKNYSSTTDDGFLKVTVQAKSNQSSWMGLTKQVTNCSSATFIRIKYKINKPCYILELVLWDLNRSYLKIYYLPQWQEWSEETIVLTEEESSKIAKVGLIMWTKDTFLHTLEIDYIFFGKVEVVS